ncbi:hypothetical protein BBJ28_00010493 [Nothophytophthora sp. Chile5]|nr:hypothetical protein BBJ28_00010493 [Nothophytophthora sp. Chile5]
MPADVAFSFADAVAGRARRNTLTKAESEDFAAAEVPLQVLTAPLPLSSATSPPARSTTPRNGVKKRVKSLRFSFKASNMKTQPISEGENEDAVSVSSPASASSCSDSTCSLSTTTSASTKRAVGPQDFDLLCVIGQGAFGKVIQLLHVCYGLSVLTAVCLNDCNQIVSNKYIVKKNSVSYLQAERDIMAKINHPFLISLRYAFQTKSNVYLVMPFVAGGELFHHLHKEGLLLESSAKFYAAEMVLALEHLHARGIIHRYD